MPVAAADEGETLRVCPPSSQVSLRWPFYGECMDRYGNQPFLFRGGGGFIERAGHGGGTPDLAWVIFALLLVLLLLAIVSLALDAYYRSQGPRPFMKWLGPGGPPGMLPGDRAVGVLNMRYARGEISRKDYLRAREDLGVPDPEADAETITEVEAPPPGRRWRKPS
jgi:hypothetical protein